jgi:hypothetical protein
MVDMLTGLIGSHLGILVPLAGFVGVFVGVGLILRISHAEEKAPASSWRFRDLASDPALLHPAIEERRYSPRSARRDVASARRMARTMLAAAVALPVFVLLAWLIQPGDIGPMFSYEPPWYLVALPWAGAAGYVLGLGWMIRIYRANPEPGDRTWRYRA